MVWNSIDLQMWVVYLANELKEATFVISSFISDH